MGIRILKREYSNPFRPEVTDWLLGNVGDWIKAKFTIEAGVDYIASQSEPLNINTEEKTIRLMNGKKWANYGFDVGSNVNMSYVIETTDTEGVTTSETVEFDFNIEQLYNDTIVYDEIGEFATLGFETIPTERANTRVYAVKMYINKEMQGARVKYAHISNNEVQSHALTSFIDGTTTEAIYVGLDSIGSGIANMDLLPKQSGMSIKSATIKKVEAQENENTGRYTLTPGEINMSFSAASRNKVAESILAVRNEGVSPPFSLNINNDAMPMTNEAFGTYTDGIASTNFINNAPSDGARYFDVNLNFKIVTNNNGSNPNRLRLVLIRYENGTARNFAERIQLDEWYVTNEIRGQLLNYSNIIPLNVQEGESYALAFEFSTGGGSFPVTRSIKLNVISGTYKILEAIGETGYKKIYEVEINCMISSFFEDLETFQTMQPPQIIFDANSLTDNIEITLLPEWNNPNTFIKNDMTETERLGNTGWFFENYNGLRNNFEVLSVGYTDLGGANVSALSFGIETNVKAVIGGVPNLTASSKFAYGFMWVPNNEESYKQKNTPFHKNTKINNPANEAFILGEVDLFNYEGYSEISAEGINAKNVMFSIENGNLVFQATFTPSAAFTQFFIDRPEDRNYILWVSVADSTLETNYSDRVSLIIDFSEMDYNILVSGELPGVTNSFLEHPEAYDAPGVDVYDGFLEDDILARSFFELELGKRLDRVIMGFEVENLTTGETYELDRFTANLQSFITDIQGRQQVDFNTTRGYKLEPNNNKNWVKIIRNQDSDTEGKTAYQLYFAAKIRWEEWIQRANVPVEFFNNQLPFNGSGNNWIDYLRAGNNHKINLFVIFDVEQAGIVKRYKNDFFLKFDGYDENENVTTEHKYFDNETNALLNIGVDEETGRPLGVILDNKFTRIEITYTKVSGNWDLGNVYSVTTMEIYKGAGVMEHRQLSSIWGSEIDNILIPLDGQVRLLVEQIAPNKIKTSCLVDYRKLTNATKYKITGRIGCFKNENGVPIERRVYDQDQYENKYE